MTRASRAGRSPPKRVCFERLYREHARFVWMAAQRCGAPPGTVDDVVQDVFMTAYRRLDDVRWEVSPRGWLYGVTRRVVFRYRRSVARTARRGAALKVVADVTTTATDGQAVEEAGELERLLATLSASQRRLVVMSELLGMSGPEIAAELGIPVNTAYSRLRAVRGRLEAAARSAVALDEALARSRRSDRPSARQVERGWIALAPMLRTPWVPVAAAGLGKTTGGLVAIGVTIVTAAVVALTVSADDRGKTSSRRAKASTAVVAEVGRARPQLRATPAPAKPSATAERVRDPLSAPAAAPVPAPRNDPGNRRVPTPKSPLGTPPSDVAPAVQVLAPTEPSSNDASDIEAELALLERARRRLAADDGAGALAVVAEHRRRFPHSRLADAREATRVRALCLEGEEAEAQRVAAALRRDYPQSSVAATVGDGCD